MRAEFINFPFCHARWDIRCWGAAFLIALMLGLSVAVYLGYHSPKSSGFISDHAFVLEVHSAALVLAPS